MQNDIYAQVEPTVLALDFRTSDGPILRMVHG